MAKRRISEYVGGFAELTALLAAAGDSAAEPIPVAIETPRGLLVAVLRATGRPIYPINPLAVARYRGRTSVSGKKSDHADAMTLAKILRTDAHLHRTLPADSGLAARSPCSPALTRTRSGGAPSSCRSCGPGCASTIPGSWPRSPRRFGAAAVHHPAGQRRRPRRASHRAQPGRGPEGIAARVEAALRRGGRQRRVSTVAAAVVAALRVPQLRQEPVVEQAMRADTLALLGMLNAACDSVGQLTTALDDRFQGVSGHKPGVSA